MSDIDILDLMDRRRAWSAQEKAALLAEIDAEGGKVRLVARRHQISEACSILAVSPQSDSGGDGRCGDCRVRADRAH